MFRWNSWCKILHLLFQCVKLCNWRILYEHFLPSFVLLLPALLEYFNSLQLYFLNINMLFFFSPNAFFPPVFSHAGSNIPKSVCPSRLLFLSFYYSFLQIKLHNRIWVYYQIKLLAYQMSLDIRIAFLAYSSVTNIPAKQNMFILILLFLLCLLWTILNNIANRQQIHTVEGTIASFCLNVLARIQHVED